MNKAINFLFVFLFLLALPPSSNGQVAIEAAYYIGDAGYPSTPAVGDIDADAGHLCLLDTLGEELSWRVLH